MKSIAIISSLIYVVASSIYFLFGNNSNEAWIVYYYVNNGLYIALLLLGYLFTSQSIKVASMIATAMIFQVLFISFQLCMYFCEVDYIKMISLRFWEWIWFVLAIIFVVTYKILNKWANG